MKVAMMFVVDSLLVCVFLIWDISPICGALPPAVVYRGDNMPPGDVEMQEGFKPKGMDSARRPFQKFASTSLYDHVNGHNGTGQAPDDSGYVSTSSDINVARRAVQSYGGSGYVYYIRPSSNFIDADGTLDRYHPRPDHRENEFSALWGIEYSQVLGWLEIINGGDAGYASNPDFNAAAYGSAVTGGVQPELAGFIRSHVAWLEHPWRDWTNCECTHSTSSNEFGAVQRSEKGSERTLAANSFSPDRAELMDDQCYPTSSAPDFASDYLSSVTYIKSLWVTVKLCDKAGAGTSGNISVMLGDKLPHRTFQQILTGPSSPGKQRRFRIDLSKMPNGKLPLKDFSRVRILYAPKVDEWQDSFKLQGVLLEADIGDYKGLVIDKYGELHSWLKATGPMPETVWSEALHPDDWWDAPAWDDPRPDNC